MATKMTKEEQASLTQSLREYQEMVRGDGGTDIGRELRQERRRKRKRLLLILLILLLLIGMGSCTAWRYYQSQDPYAIDREALEGLLPGKTEAEIQAELTRVIEEGKFAVSISPVIAVSGGTGKVNIENVPANHYLMKVEIVYTDPDTGKETSVYQSGVIEPGYSIAEATMAAELPHAGDGQMTAYDALAIFTALDKESKREVGKSQVKVVLAYENKANPEGGA